MPSRAGGPPGGWGAGVGVLGGVPESGARSVPGRVRGAAGTVCPGRHAETPAKKDLSYSPDAFIRRRFRAPEGARGAAKVLLIGFCPPVPGSRHLHEQARHNDARSGGTKTM